MPQSQINKELIQFCWFLTGFLTACPQVGLLAQQPVAMGEFVAESFPVVSSTELPWNVPTLHSNSPQSNATRQGVASSGIVSPAANDSDGQSSVLAGYDSGFIIAAKGAQDLQTGGSPYLMRINGWGQMRHTVLDSDGLNPDLNQLQLKRARLVFSGHAFTTDFGYFLQIDGRSSSGDGLRLLDYMLSYDVGHHYLGLPSGVLGLKAGKYKMPFTMARYLSGRELEFTDRSVASIFFDVNRSLAWGLYGKWLYAPTPVNWEVALFNGLVTGGAETGSSGQLDRNLAYSARIFCFPTGEWGRGGLADLDNHDSLATRVGVGFAGSTINRAGLTEFSRVRVVDTGSTLSSLLPSTVDEYTVNLFSLDASSKLAGWSLTTEYYFRHIDRFQGATLPSLFDHGFWLQLGKFIVPGKLQLLARWSRVQGDSGTLGLSRQSSDERAGGCVWYLRDQHARLTADVTYLDGAPVNSAVLNISPGDIGWLFRTQIQFAF